MIKVQVNKLTENNAQNKKDSKGINVYFKLQDIFFLSKNLLIKVQLFFVEEISLA